VRDGKHLKEKAQIKRGAVLPPLALAGVERDLALGDT